MDKAHIYFMNGRWNLKYPTVSPISLTIVLALADTHFENWKWVRKQNRLIESRRVSNEIS